MFLSFLKEKLPRSTHHVHPTKLTTKYVPPTTTKYVPPTTTKYVPPTTTKYIPPTTTKYVPQTTTKFEPETYSTTRFVPWTEKTTMLSQKTRSSTAFVPPEETKLPTSTPEPAPETPPVSGGGGGDPFSGGFASCKYIALITRLKVSPFQGICSLLTRFGRYFTQIDVSPHPFLHGGNIKM